jgi:hypothetical protein
MPNHITNVIKANKHVLDFLRDGDTAAITAGAGTAVAVQDEDERPEVDFNNVMPIPEALKNLSAEYKTFDTQEEVDAYNAEQRTAALVWPVAFRPSPDQVYAITDRQYGELVHEHGTALDWYNWNTQNWGTKWNAYSADRTGDTELRFDTAWAHPEPVIRALSKKFPDEVIVAQWADEDFGHNVGEYATQDGETITSNIPEGGTPLAYEMAAHIKYGQTLAEWRADYQSEYPEDWAEIYAAELDPYIDGVGELES